MRLSAPQARGQKPALKPTRSGTAAIEFAVAAPILVTLVVGMIELSRAMLVKEYLNNAARIGCRKGIQPNKANSDITSDAGLALTADGLNPSDANFTILVNGNNVDASTAMAGDQISVKVSISWSKVFWGGTVFLSSSIIESETIVMMRQG
jgi:Flp pilus assembly protein TadG